MYKFYYFDSHYSVKSYDEVIRLMERITKTYFHINYYAPQHEGKKILKLLSEKKLFEAIDLFNSLKHSPKMSVEMT